VATVKRFRLAVFLFLIAFLFFFATSFVFGDKEVINNLPLGVTCNYSTGVISPEDSSIYITDKNTNAACPDCEGDYDDCIDKCGLLVTCRSDCLKNLSTCEKNADNCITSFLAYILRGKHEKWDSDKCKFQLTVSGFNGAGQEYETKYINDSLHLKYKTDGTGTVLQDKISIDPDKLWSLLNLPSSPEFDIAKLRFVEDPFVLLNSSKRNEPAFWGFHGGYGDRSLDCQARPENGGVNSTKECVEYTFSKKFANCRGDIEGDFKCCGDDDLIDPGFEATNSEMQLYAWKTAGEKCQYLSFCSRTGTEKHTGRQSFQIIASSSVSNLSQKLSLGQGNYYLSFWIKTIKAPQIEVNVADESLAIGGGSSDWKHYELPFDISEEKNITVLFKVSPTTASGAKVWIDDVHILGKKYSQVIQGLTDYGKIFNDITPPPNGPTPYLCYHNNTQWEWMNPVNEQFKILEVNGFDMISNSIGWYACNANGLAEDINAGEDKIQLTGNYETVSYTPSIVTPTIVTYGELEKTTSDYGVGDNTAFIPDSEFEPGIAIQNVQPPGAADHCFNKILDESENESDVDCGDGCAKCYDGQKCKSNDDCISGICTDDGTGQKRCIPINFPQINWTGYIAKRFICSNMDEIATYTECCGYSLGLCMNQNLKSNIRRAGNPLDSIFEFPVKTDNINYVLLMGLPYYQPVSYYNYPLLMSKADNPLYNWTNYSYLEFYIAYAVPPENKYLRLLVLKDVEESPFSTNTPKKYVEGGNLEDDVLFRGYIDNFTTGQIQPGKWVRVRIPIIQGGDKTNAIKKSDVVKMISFYADESDVPFTNRVTHAALPGLTFRNVIAIDRIHLVPSDSNKLLYCSKFPPFSTQLNYWGNDMDSTYSDVSNQPIGKGICEATPGFGWTGTMCCGDDLKENPGLALNPKVVAESYVDSLHGCVKGFTLRNDSTMLLKLNSGNASLMFYNTKFYTCNNAEKIQSIETELNYSGSGQPISSSTLVDINTSTAGMGCYNQGSWYCDYDSVWKNSSAIPGQIINFSTSLPFDENKKACCPAGWCFYGNESAPKSCVPSQANVFQYKEPFGIPYFFNSSQKYSGIEGDNHYYRCINGTWKLAEIKWNPDNTDMGYCPELSQCYLSATEGCVDSGFFRGDDYCENGNWSSRTKLVARQLFNISQERINELGEGSIERATLYCDKFDEVLAQVDYADIELSPKTVREIITGGAGGCPGLNGIPCANNFCALTIVSSGGNEKTYIGTSMNIPVDTTNSDYSILKLFKEAVSTIGANHNDFCDYAIIESNRTKKYVGCKYSSTVSPGAGNANIWINNETQTLIYSKEAFDISNTVTTSDFFSFFFRNPIAAVFSWARIKISGGSEKMRGTDEFLANLSDFRKLYWSTGKGLKKEIRGAIETKAGKNMMAVGYKNIETNLCYGNSTASAIRISETNPTVSCNLRINKTDFWQNLYSEDISYWKDLTTNTRISGDYTNPGLNSELTISGPDIGMAGDVLTYNVTINKAQNEDLISVSVDWGDGLAVSIPANKINFESGRGSWIVSHSFSKKIVKGKITAGILGSNYGIAIGTTNVDIIPKPQDYYTVNENIAQRPSSLIINLSELSEWTVEINSQDDWLNCRLSNHIINCTPDLNKNFITNGIGNLTIVVEGKVYIPIQIYVVPVNSPPEFSQDFPSVMNSPEDNPPMDSWTINLLDYVSDIETAKEDLWFGLSGTDPASSQLLIDFNCSITDSILKCTSFKQNYNGMIHAKIIVTDKGEGSSPAESAEKIVEINITPVNDPPVVSIPNFTLDTDFFILFDYYPDLNVKDVDNDISEISLECSRLEGDGASNVIPEFNDNKQLAIETFDWEEKGVSSKSDRYNCTATDGEASSEPSIFNVTVKKITPPYFISFSFIPTTTRENIIPILPIVNEGDFINISMIAQCMKNKEIREFSFFSTPQIKEGYSWTNIEQPDPISSPTKFSTNFSWNTSTAMMPINKFPTENPSDNDVLYNITFTATDSDGLIGEELKQFWLNRRPALILLSNSTLGYSYNFSFNASDYDKLKTCIIDFDDGNMQDYSSSCNGHSFFNSGEILHTYTEEGNYVVKVNVTDSYGALSTMNITVTTPGAST